MNDFVFLAYETFALIGGFVVCLGILAAASAGLTALEGWWVRRCMERRLTQIPHASLCIGGATFREGWHCTRADGHDGPHALEPVKFRVQRVNPTNFRYEYDGDHITHATETDDDGNIVAEYDCTADEHCSLPAAHPGQPCDLHVQELGAG